MTIVVRNDTWDSGLAVVEKPKIQINHKLLLLCNEIQDKIPSTEFSILAKAEFVAGGVIVGEEYVIPGQEVTAGTVDYDDITDYKNQGFNCVIHSHHNMGSFFSTTDMNFINAHFKVSILYTKRAFTLATIGFHEGDNVFLIRTEDVSTFIMKDFELEGFENIRKKSYQHEAGLSGFGKNWKGKTQYERNRKHNNSIKAKKKEWEKEKGFEVDCKTCKNKNTISCVHCDEDDDINAGYG